MNKKPQIVGGARQVGKTYSIRELGKQYASYIEINFITHPQHKAIFNDGHSAQSIIKNISLMQPDIRFVDGDTLIFDEMQEFPDCNTSLKFFSEDGRYDVICSGSLMGLNYKDITSNLII